MARSYVYEIYGTTTVAGKECKRFRTVNGTFVYVPNDNSGDFYTGGKVQKRTYAKIAKALHDMGEL